MYLLARLREPPPRQEPLRDPPRDPPQEQPRERPATPRLLPLSSCSLQALHSRQVCAHKPQSLSLAEDLCFQDVMGCLDSMLRLQVHLHAGVVLKLESGFQQLMKCAACAGVNGAAPTVTLPTPAADTSATGTGNSQGPTDLNPASGTGTVDNSGNINAPAPPTGVHPPSVSLSTIPFMPALLCLSSCTFLTKGSCI